MSSTVAASKPRSANRSSAALTIRSRVAALRCWRGGRKVDGTKPFCREGSGHQDELAHVLSGVQAAVRLGGVGEGQGGHARRDVAGRVQLDQVVPPAVQRVRGGG